MGSKREVGEGMGGEGGKRSAVFGKFGAGR